jgi:uncharacterized protein YcbX
MASVVGFNLTPVKSTALLTPSEVELETGGAIGDRRFLFARLDGSRPSGISKAPLLRLRARWDREREGLSLVLHDGTKIEGDARARGDSVEVRLFDRSVPARGVDPIFDEAVASIDPTLTLMRVDEPEYAGGRHRASLVSRASVAEVGRSGRDAALDPRRFRMLVEIDGVEPFAEDRLSGRRVSIGEAIVRVGRSIPRCVVTTLNPVDGRQDFPTLDMLARTRKVGRDLLLGVYADVERPGVVRVGDDVTPLDG